MLTLNPEYEEAKKNMYSLGLKCLEYDRLDLAEKLAEVLIKTDETNYDYIDLLGVIKYKNGIILQAIDIFEKLYTIDPSNKLNINNLILTYNEVGSSETALKYQNILDSLNRSTDQ